MLMIRKDSPKRSLAKTISWRFVGAIDTTIISWLLTGNPLNGFHMGLADTASKLLFFYLHERIWEHFNTINNKKLVELQKGKNRRIHLLKALTWRTFSSSLTFFLGWVILNSAKTGLIIAGIEFFTKFMLYYLHERLWYRTSFGVEKIDSSKIE